LPQHFAPLAEGGFGHALKQSAITGKRRLPRRQQRPDLRRVILRLQRIDQLDEAHRPRPGDHGHDKPSRAGRSPVQLFGDYLQEQNVADERVERMFAELLEDMTDSR